MKNLRQRKMWIVLISVLMFCLIAGTVTMLALHRREQVLEEQQNEALQELYDNQGRYDEQSIVLSNTTMPRAEELAEAFGAELRITEDGSFAALTLPEGVTVFDIYENEDYRKYIEYMSLDYQAKISDLLPSDETEDEASSERLPIRPQYTVSDTDYNRQTYLDYLNMSNVWNKTKGSGITVAVIDTGIDTDHPEFVGRISEYSYNASEDKIVKDYLLEDGSYDWSLVEDEQGHGTAVTGVIAASMDGNGVVGIAPQVNIIVIKAECDEYGNFERTSDLVFGLYYAIERDVSVVNMSFGTYGSNPFAEPAQLAFDSDVICVAAAGNDATANLTYPAADENVFGVGALAQDSWELASYSNYGENVDFVAHGTVYTTKMGGGYGGMNGTSFASPVTAGVLALYMSQNKYAEFNTVEELIYASCYDLGDLGPDFYYGYGALDVSALMLEQRGTVTFNMMTDELDNTEQVFIRTHTLQNMPEPERLYAIFDGWYYDPQCTEEYVWYEDEFHSDLTLYANWVNEEDGIPFTYVELDDGTIEIRSYTGHRRYITIPDYIDGKVVSSIGEFAFKGETRLREVKLPKYLKRIRMSAFEGCSNLVSMEIPDTVTEIGANAFYDNVRLSTLTLGVNSQLVSIGDYAFSGCAKMRTFTVPSKVTTLNATAFYRNTSMIAYDVQVGNTAFTAKDGVLFNYTGSTLVCYPAGLKGTYTVSENVKTVGDYAFACTKLSGVELSNVERLGGFAFAYGSLESVTIPDSVTSMGSYVFAFCRNMRTAELGAGLTDISAYAFASTALRSIEFPANIRSIGDSAFANIGSLAKITFAPNSTLTYIGTNAFFDSGVISVEIPASVTTIDAGAFGALYCPYLSSLTFEENSSLYTIGASAFASQYRLTAVVLPDHLAHLGGFAFNGTGLITVDIPAGVSYFGIGAFASCHSLTDIWVEDENARYLDVDGVVFNTEKATLVAYPSGNERNDYTVPEGVTDIGEAAFYGSWNLTRVNLASTVTTVREQAFYDCEKITGYKLSDKLTYIKAYAFSQNYALRSMSMPDSLMQISNHAFAEDWSLSSVTFSENAKLPRISYGAFAYCGLTSFRVPASVSTMAQGAFMGCSNLQSFTFAKNSKLESISAYMFDGCSSLRFIIFEKGSALTSIQAHGLEGLRELLMIEFGDAKLTNIDNFAFRFCESLTRFDIPEGVTFLGRYAFYCCTRLSEVTVPSSMNFIGRFAFLGTEELNVYFASETLPVNLAEDWDHGIMGYYLGVTDVVTEGDWTCAKLTNGDISIIKYNGTATEIDMTTLNLGGKIINIGGGAFMDSTVQSVKLPETLQIIQAEAFYHSELKSISIPEGVTFIGRSAFAYTPIETLTFASNSNVKTIEQSAFEKTEKLGSVTIPASVTTMGRAAFKSSGITLLTFADGFSMTEIPEEAFAYTHISTVTIPYSVTLINHNAFREIKELKSVILGSGEELMIMSNVFYQSGLENVYLPENVGYVGEYAFVGLSKLTKFTVAANNPYYKAVDGLLVSKDGRKLIAVPAGREGSLTVPEGIEVIGFGAFEDSKLSEIKFLDNANILSFGCRAFYNADGITEMHIPASVVAIDYYAFAMCDNLQTVTFAKDNNLKGVYEGAFYGCKNLSDIMLPDSIVEISDFAFYGCRKLTDVPVSETSELKGIYDYAFAYAGFSGDYTTPETLIDIGAYAFMGNKFASVTIPDTNYWDLIIGIGAFEDCQELTEITVPFIGASFEDDEITWFGYIFGAGAYEANVTYVPESLKKVNISEGITFVGEHAFDRLTGLEEMSIPHSVQLVHDYAFNGTTAKYELTNEITFMSKYGSNIFSSHEVSSIHIGKGISGHLELANGVVYIDYSAFAGRHSLLGITIPDSVIDLGIYAFSNCSSLTSINIPNSVTSISYGAFNNCSSLTDVSFGDNSRLTSIGEEAFKGCSNLTSINIPNSVTSIGDSAFYNCNSLTSITIPDSITSIGCSTFEFCHSLTSITIPDSVTSIGNSAFSACSNLMSITIPDRVTDIGDDAFSACGSIYLIYNHSNLSLELGSSAHGKLALFAKLIIDKEGNKIYKGETSLECIDTADGFCFVKETDKYKLIAYLGEDETVTLPKDILGNSYEIYQLIGVRNVIIPDNVTNIGHRAFSGCDTLTSITIPDGVKSIGTEAFSGCRRLTSIEFGKNSQLTSIGYSAFYGCGRLTNITIPDGVKSIGPEAFSGCSSLTSITIPDGVTSIGYFSFSGCSSLTSITIPDSVTSIGSSAFSSCSSLTSITIPDGVTSIGVRAFFACSSLTSITIPDGVKRIVTEAFSGCSSLTSITIPDGVTSIGDRAFSGCRSLKSIEIPDDVKSIGSSAFSDCSSLMSITIPDSVTDIGGAAFFNCGSLTSITIPDGVTSIGSSAFSDCSSLTNITIPDGVTSIGDYAFGDCSSLTSITIPDGVTSIGSYAFLGCPMLELTVSSGNLSFTTVDGILYDKDITQLIYVPDSVTELCIPKTVIDFSLRNNVTLQKITFEADSVLINIGDQAFSGCSSLTSITIPDGVTSIGYFSFSGCSSLTGITIPDRVTDIGDDAFSDCSSLMSITIPDSVTDIGVAAFFNCSSLTSIDFGDNSQLTNIGDWAFAGCDSLMSIAIPDGVKSIGYSAFSVCDSLTNIDFGDNSQLTSIGEQAFYGCGSLTNIDFGDNSQLTSIGNSAFYNCDNLSSITISEDMMSIGEDAFWGCIELSVVYNNSSLALEFGSDSYGYIACSAKLIIDKEGNVMYKGEASGAEYIGTAEGFGFIKESNKYKLIAYFGDDETVTLPKDILGNPYEIYEMVGVRNVIIPDGVTSIGEFAFGSCSSLTSITIPDSVTSIGNYAFTNCRSLTNITISNGVKSIGDHAFRGCSSLKSITIPDGVKSIGEFAFGSCSSLTSITIPDGVNRIGKDAFSYTAYYNTPENWDNMCLYISNYLIRVNSDAVYMDLKDGTVGIAQDAFEGCYLLKEAAVLGNQYDILAPATNLETLVLLDMPSGSIYRYFGNNPSAIPLTLKSIVLAKDVPMKKVFYGITGITIYVEANENDVRWDENFPGWNNGNYVLYGDEWITADFYDQNGKLMSSENFLTSQVIRQPYLELVEGLEETQVLVGWDMNGDGEPDTIPATSTVDIVAKPIIEIRAREYTVSFFDADGVTLVSKVVLPYGAEIVAPMIEEKKGYTTNGWIGYVESMTVSGNHVFVLDRVHNGDGHDYAESVWVAPTCTEQGYNKHVCKICDEWYETDHIEANGHDYCSAVTESTCTEKGEIRYTCRVCGHGYSEDIPAHGHNYTDTVIKEAICTCEGEMAYTCNDCGHKVIEKTPLAAHDYQKKIVPKWWLQILIERISNVFFGYESDNTYYYECTYCKQIQTAEESKSGSGTAGNGITGVQSAGCVHQLGDWVEYLSPCEGNKIDARICLVCEKAIEFRRGADALGHDYDEHIVTDPTCTEDGYTTHTCSRCGDSYTDSEVAALGHTAGAGADCLNDQVCTVCGEVLVEKLGHEYEAVITDPTCTAEGFTTHTCSRCDDSYIDSEIEALPHTPGTEADCLNNQVCTVCGEVLVEKLGHTYESVITKPTCTEKGYTTHTCPCGDTYMDTYVDASGHKESKWIIDVKAQVGVEGSRHKECTECGEILKTEAIEALPDSTSDKKDNVLTDILSGCRSTLGSNIMLVAIMIMASMVFVKKKQDD